MRYRLVYIVILIGAILAAGINEFFIKKPDKDNSFKSFNNGKYELSIILSKQDYKEYEPVIVEFSLINHDTTPLILDDIFNDDYYNGAQLIFKDKDNKDVPTRSKFQGLIDDLLEDTLSSYVINQNDTLYVAMPINNWGDDLYSTKKRREGLLFNCYGYFHQGLYKFKYLNSRGKNELSKSEYFISNEVSMRIENNDFEDLSILNDIRKNYLKTDMIKYFKNMIEKYPGNTYSMQMRYEYIRLIRVFGDENVNLITEYEKFIRDYPDSPYLLYDKFIQTYIYHLSKSFINIEDATTYINSHCNNEKIRKYISNKKRLYNAIVHKIN